MGSTLYGTTAAGGSSEEGTLFRIQTDGTAFNVLHAFGYGPSNGRKPSGGLLLSGSNFYGVTQFGGSESGGTVYRIGPDGSGFSILHSFPDSIISPNGSRPTGELIQSGSKLFGTTLDGGSTGHGTLYRIGTDGTGFGVMHALTYPEGNSPINGLVQSDDLLFGVAGPSFGYNQGTLFATFTDGTDFGIMHTFQGSWNFPLGPLTLSDSSLYGVTFGDIGTVHGGVIYRIPVGVPEPTALSLSVSCLSLICLWRHRRFLGRHTFLRRV